MPLQRIDLDVPVTTLPPDADAFIADADQRINQFLTLHDPVPGFVPCDFHRAYQALAVLKSQGVLTGTRFLEWGSGFGVVTGLAALLGYAAHGIEIDADLVERSRELCVDHGVKATFVRGSLVLDDRHDIVDRHSGGEVEWLVAGAEPGYDELGRDLDDFDLVFAYPWPGEEGVLKGLFEADAASGAVLCLYEGREDVSLWRRV